jgi:hypothetical protein
MVKPEVVLSQAKAYPDMSKKALKSSWTVPLSLILVSNIRSI